MLQEFQSSIQPFFNEYSHLRTIFVAFSGGVDSHVLLDLLMRFSPIPVAAIHINHNLQPLASTFERHCQQICRQYHIPCHVLRVDVRDRSQGLEAAARAIRRRALQTFLTADEAICFAHHANDQAETLLLQLLRGGGVSGLAGMPRIQNFGDALLWRPLLPYTREMIIAYAHSQQLSWIEDPTNQHPEFDRNYLRHQVMPLLQQRWPQAIRCFNRSSDHCHHASHLLEELAQQDYQLFNQDGSGLSLPCLAQLSLPRQINVIRYWLKQANLPELSTQQVQQLFTTVIHAKADATPRLAWGHCEIRRYHGKLYAHKIPASIKLAEKVNWNLQEPLELPHLRLSAWQVLGQGISVSRLLDLDKISIRFREYGERFHPAGRIGSHPLKKLMQEWKIPPWQRNTIPLLYYQNELIAVIPYAIRHGLQALPHELGWLIQTSIKE
ncbi:MAG: tRNA lysidine(34) synthetase TilS [Legionellales bacterium]|nr:tRNA lysidine(34) synthetase TilS [Legionellales bacterium]